MTIAESVLHLPVGFNLRLAVEVDPDYLVAYLTACVFQSPPADGWPDRHEADRYADRVLFGVSAGSAADLERLLSNAIVKRCPVKQVLG